MIQKITALAAGSCALLAVSGPLNADVLFHYNFEADTAGVAGAIHDRSEAGNDGSSKGAFVNESPAVITGNTSLRVNGKMESWADVDTPGYTGVAAAADRTFVAWVKTSKAADQVVFSYGTAKSGQFLVFRIDQSGSGFVPRVEIGGAGFNGTTRIDDGAWHHLALVVDSSQADNVLIYVDGKLDTAAPLALNTVPGLNLRVGGNVLNNQRIWNGHIDDAAFYDEALTADQIASLASGAKTPLGVAATAEGDGRDDRAGLSVGTDPTVARDFGQERNSGAPRPNIVHIFADDLGYGNVGYTDDALGDNHPIQTPNIDALAAAGMIFNNAYACTVCTPSRSALMLGFHDGHTLADRNANNDQFGGTFRDQDRCIAEVLRQAGYRTGLFGKHGFGGSEGGKSPLKSGVTVHDPAALPNRIGYEEFFGYLDQTRAHDYFIDELWESDPLATHGVRTVSLGNTAATPHVTYSHDPIASRSLDFIRDFANRPEPFYLQVNYTIPHFNLEDIDHAPAITIPDRAQPAGLGIYASMEGLSRDQKRHAAMVTRMDSSIGHLVAKLRDPNGDGDPGDSVMGETIIIVTSDNGGYRNYRPLASFKLNGNFRDEKATLYEGGLHVPGLACWEGVIPAGSHTDLETDLADFFPTAAELAGIRPPVGIDGVSILPTLLGEGTQRRRPYLIFENGTSDWAIIRNRMKLIEFGDGTQQLYDLSSDVGESNPLNLDEPDHAAMRDALRALALGEHVEVTGDFAVQNAEWTGGDGGRLDSANWTIPGTPADHWSAVVNNVGTGESTLGTPTIGFLGLEVRGDLFRQTVRVEPGATLTGRNEIRIGRGGRLHLDGATLKTLRWIEVHPDGELSGHGTVTGGQAMVAGVPALAADRYLEPAIYNNGTLSPGADPALPAAGGGPVPLGATGTLSIMGSLTNQPGGILAIDLGGNNNTNPDRPEYDSVSVENQFNIEGGNLAIRLVNSYVPPTGATFDIAKAGTRDGSFAHSEDIVLAADGTSTFRVLYTPTTVRLEKVPDGSTARGTPNWWLADHGIASDATDTDGDGRHEWEEYAAKTDPQNPD
jgi:arylsulfatase A-like enzyme